MGRIDSFQIRTAGEKSVGLWQGDLTSMTTEAIVDAMVISAFPGDYTPTEASVIGALHRVGISVHELAVCKDVDLLERFGCWLSKRVPNKDSGVRRIICFEPDRQGKPPEVVGDLFRALTPILAVRPEIETIAIPLLSTGDAGWPVDQMADALLDAIVHWMEVGLPIKRAILIARSEEKAGLVAARFSLHKDRYVLPSTDGSAPLDYDVFISYAHADASTMQAFETALRRLRPGVRLFIDHHKLDPGMLWQTQIFRSLDRSSKVVAILSPDYVSSKVCEEEFNIAWLRSRNTHQDLPFPIYAASAELPTYMLYKQYFDCRDDDGTALDRAARQLVLQLDAEPTVSMGAV